MPQWGCPAPTLRRAVESVLGQSHTALRLVVVNDGDDAERVWGALDDIHDHRLTRFDLPRNRGRFFADAVVLRACRTPLFSVHDSDDWSEPEWLSTLVDHVNASGVIASFSAQVIHRGARSRVEQTHPMLTTREPIVRFSQLAHHAGLYRTAALRAVGGAHPAYRIGYDTMLVNLIRMFGPCSASTSAHYHRVSRLGSLTTSRQTGFGSPARCAVQTQLRGMYHVALSTPPAELGDMVRRTVPTALAAEVSAIADKLRAIL